MDLHVRRGRLLVVSGTIGLFYIVVGNSPNINIYIWLTGKHSYVHYTTFPIPYVCTPE